jgi:hypothetical protein
MAGLDSQSNIVRKSVAARYHALESALTHPELVLRELIQACSSQSALAALSLPNLDILPISRNSMYKYADELLADKKTLDNKVGRFYLDWLRKEVMTTLQLKESFRSVSATNKRMTARSNDVLEKLRATEAAILIRSKAYFNLIQSMNSMRNNRDIDEVTRQKISNLLLDHEILYGHIFDEIDTPQANNNVKKIRP